LLDIHSAFIYYVCGYPTMHYLNLYFFYYFKESRDIFRQLVH